MLIVMLLISAAAAVNLIDMLVVVFCVLLILSAVDLFLFFKITEKVICQGMKMEQQREKNCLAIDVLLGVVAVSSFHTTSVYGPNQPYGADGGNDGFMWAREPVKTNDAEMHLWSLRLDQHCPLTMMRGPHLLSGCGYHVCMLSFWLDIYAAIASWRKQSKCRLESV